MPRARVKFKPPYPRGLYKFSTEHPDDEIRILSSYPTSDGLHVVLEVEMADLAAIDHLFDETHISDSYEILHTDEQMVLVQYVLPFIPPPYRAIFDSDNLPQFPFTIRDGWMTCEMTTSQERLSQFRDELESTGFTLEVISVVQSTDSTEVLTDRQQEFITEAVERGYYESPRECTLTDLAAALDVTKGAASGTLHRAERRIIKTFLGKPAV